MGKRTNNVVSAESSGLALAAITLIITLVWAPKLSRLAGLTVNEFRALAISLASAALALWLIPKWQVTHLSELEGINAKDVLEAENAARATLARILGGLFFLGTLYVSWQNLQVSRQQETTAEFTAAINQLSQVGGDKLDIRIGGIRALARLAMHSDGYCEPIKQILTAFVHEHAQPREVGSDTPSAPPAQRLTSLGLGRSEDIETALYEISYLGCRLSGELNLRHVDLSGSDLTNLELENAHFYEANLQRAILRCTHFENSHFQFAHLEGAYFTGAHLEDGDFNRAHLDGMHLEGAHLKGAVHLTIDQVRNACWDAKTEWPDGFTPPARPSCRLDTETCSDR